MKYFPFLISVVVTVGCLILFSGCQSSPHTSESELSTNAIKSTRMDSLMKSYVDQGQFNGTVLVAHSGKVIYQAALGVSNTETKQLLEVSSQFYIASIAKQITCMAIMMLQAEGKLDYDDKIRTFFPDLPPWADEVSIRHMMNHTSGIPDYYEMGIPRPGFGNGDVYRALMEVPALDFPANSAYAYSNSAYVLLSMVIERASGQSFKEFVETRIFRPLDMHQSMVFDSLTPPVAGRAIGYTLELEKDDYQFYTTGGGGIFSNVTDLFKWNQALYGSQLIDQPRLQAAYSPVQLNNDSLSFYGFGWQLNQQTPMIVQHSGSLNGFRTYIRRNLDQQHCIILLSNHSNIWLKDILMNLSAILNENV